MADALIAADRRGDSAPRPPRASAGLLTGRAMPIVVTAIACGIGAEVADSTLAGSIFGAGLGALVLWAQRRA